MSLLLDTYALIELFEGGTDGEKVKKLVEKEKEIFVSVLSLYETGIVLEREIGKEKAEEYLKSIQIYYSLVDLDRMITIDAVTLRRTLKLPAIDCLIYASARSVNAKVVSGCMHFKSISKNKDVIIV